MKTYILQLEAHDDITSAKDKMGWGKSNRILVVWPEKGQVLNRRLDLILLKRHAGSLGAQIALVARDAEIKYFAPRLGIPVYRSLPKAQNSAWRLPRRFRSAQPTAHGLIPREQITGAENPPDRIRSILNKTPKGASRLHPLIRIGLFSISVLSFLILAALLAPGAEILLTPQIQEQGVTIFVRASPEIPSVQLSGSVPARKISVVVEGRDSLPSSSTVSVPDRPATGSVRFTNLSEKAVEIPAGTVVRSLGREPLRFEVTTSGTIVAGPGQTGSLPVRCLTLGVAGNLPAGSLIAIEGLLGTRLSVTNPLPTRNGRDRTLPLPNVSDRATLAIRLRESLQSTAQTELQNSLAEGDLLIPSSIRLVEVLDQNYQPAQGQPADQLQLTLRAEFEGFSVAWQDLVSLAEMVLNAGMPKGVIPLEGTLQIENLNKLTFQDVTAEWTMAAHRQVQASLSESQAVRLSLGLAPEMASRRLLANLPLLESPIIRLSPPWWPRLPYLPFRIQVRVNDATALTPGVE